MQKNPTHPNNLYNQKLYNIDDLLLSKHAYDRITSRGIRSDEILCSWTSTSTLRKNTRENRTIYSNYEYGLFIVIDNNTNIIITIIEMEWRKYRTGIYNTQKKYGIKPSAVYIPVIY